MKVYRFLYNPMIYESSLGTISIHKTRKGAEMAMEFHKAEALKEWEEDNKRDPDLYSEFGTFEYWGIDEMEIQE